jgi:protein SCO1
MSARSRWHRCGVYRDTPERLKQHLAYFSTDFIGLTGDEETLHKVIREYGGDFLINDGGGYRTENYSVDHTASKFLLDSEGQWVRTYGYNVDPDLIAADLAQLLTPTSSDTQ